MKYIVKVNGLNGVNIELVFDNEIEARSAHYWYLAHTKAESVELKVEK